MACRRCLQGDKIFATGPQLAHLLSNRPMEPSAMRGDSALRSSRLRLRCSSAVVNGPGSALGPRRAIGPLAGLGRVRMAPCVRRGCRAVGLASLVVLWTGGSPAWASLADLLKEPQFKRLELAPIAPALAATVASTYPVASASSGVVYAYNPALDTLERQTGVAGPIIGERAETIGKGQLNLAVSYSYVDLTSINGDDLDSLLNRPRVNGKRIVLPVQGVVTFADGRLLGMAVPTRSRNTFQGTGAKRLQPTLIFSHVYGRFEPLVNVDIDLNTNDVSRSVVGWAAGGTAQVLNRLSVSAVFLGRHELAPLAEPLTTPFFFQIERNDQYAASVGYRWRLAASGFVSANAIVPLNDQGLRAAVIPTLELEYAF